MPSDLHPADSASSIHGCIRVSITRLPCSQFQHAPISSTRSWRTEDECQDPHQLGTASWVPRRWFLLGWYFLMSRSLLWDRQSAKSLCYSVGLHFYISHWNFWELFAAFSEEKNSTFQMMHILWQFWVGWAVKTKQMCKTAWIAPGAEIPMGQQWKQSSVLVAQLFVRG